MRRGGSPTSLESSRRSNRLGDVNQRNPRSVQQDANTPICRKNSGSLIARESHAHDLLASPPAYLRLVFSKLLKCQYLTNQRGEATTETRKRAFSFLLLAFSSEEGNVSTSSLKAQCSGGGSLRGAEPHLMRVIKTLMQVWRREPEEPSIGAAGRKYADLAEKAPCRSSCGKAMRMNYLLFRRHIYASFFRSC